MSIPVQILLWCFALMVIIATITFAFIAAVYCLGIANEWISSIKKRKK